MYGSHLDPSVLQRRPGAPARDRRRRWMRVTVGTIVGLIASGYTIEQILEKYPYLEREDIMQVLSYAAWRAQEVEIELAA